MSWKAQERQKKKKEVFSLDKMQVTSELTMTLLAAFKTNKYISYQAYSSRKVTIYFKKQLQNLSKLKPLHNFDSS